MQHKSSLNGTGVSSARSSSLLPKIGGVVGRLSRKTAPPINKPAVLPFDADKHRSKRHDSLRPTPTKRTRGPTSHLSPAHASDRPNSYEFVVFDGLEERNSSPLSSPQSPQSLHRKLSNDLSHTYEVAPSVPETRKGGSSRNPSSVADIPLISKPESPASEAQFLQTSELGARATEKGLEIGPELSSQRSHVATAATTTETNSFPARDGSRPLEAPPSPSVVGGSPGSKKRRLDRRSPRSGGDSGTRSQPTITLNGTGTHADAAVSSNGVVSSSEREGVDLSQRWLTIPEKRMILVRKRQGQMLEHFDQARFDLAVYSQPDVNPPPGISTQGTWRPATSLESSNPKGPFLGLSAHNSRYIANINPHVHWTQKRSEEWYRKKISDIRCRPGRKQNFGRAANRLVMRRRTSEVQGATGNPSNREFGRPLDFGDVPEADLPDGVKENPAWLRATAWLRNCHNSTLEKQKEIDRRRREGRPWEHLLPPDLR